MRETPLSNCEKEFIRKALSERKRLDGRQAYDYRTLKIAFGNDRGCCRVDLGQTRVLAQVSCEVTSPKQQRPSEGVLFVNVELSPMASPAFEIGRMSDQGVEINRILERCLKESRCVDTESLCIISGEKVWQIRVDVHVMNNDGNIIDCSSIAAITALAHFRRPDVTVNGTEVIIHTVEEKDPIPLSVHHMPICVSFSFYEQGKFLLVDPSDKEEKVMDGKMVIGMNKHREICTLQVTGQMLLLKDQVLRCSNIAVVKVTEITELIHKALENDKQARSSGVTFGFREAVVKDAVTTNQMTPEKIDESTVQSECEDEDDSVTMETNGHVYTDSELNEEPKVRILAKGVGCIGGGGDSKWDIDDDDMEEEVKAESAVKSKIPEQSTEVIFLDDSEEEGTTTLQGHDLNKIPERVVPVKKSQPVDLSALKKKKKEKKKKKKQIDVT